MRRMLMPVFLAAGLMGCADVGKSLEMPMDGTVHEQGVHPDHPNAPAEGKAVAVGDERSWRKSNYNAVNGRYTISPTKPNATPN